MMRVLTIIAAVIYAITWATASWYDEAHCHDQGVEYAGTSLGLDGYCSIQGIEVPVEGVWRDD